MLEKPASSIRFNRILLTGAAGNLGQVLRPRLKAYCSTLRVSHRKEFGPAHAGEEVVIASLENADEMMALLDGVDAVVHMGGVSTEQPWEPILAGNIIIFASSNHATGFYKQSETIPPTVKPKPDGFYGLSKAFGENVGQMYWNRWGIETLSVRIGSSFPEPVDRRMLATWLSYDDLERVVVAGFTAPIIEHTGIYGMSDNQTTWWDNTPAKHVGYRPLDSSDIFKDAAEAKQQTIDVTDPVAIYQGGGFVKATPHG